MNIQVLSDLHFEFHSSYINSKDIIGDVVVLAGDIHTNPRDLAIKLSKIFKNKPVIYVLGNHEYYGNVWESAVEEYKFYIEKQKLDNIHILSNDAIEINNTRFLGATLWTDFFNKNEKIGLLYEQTLADSSCIMKEDSVLAWKDIYNAHKTSVKWLKSELENRDNANTVVVTHHAPSALSVHPRFAGSRINGCFYSNLDDIILEYSPSLWIHGHTHNSFEYSIGNTKVICNPHGYENENPSFNKHFLFDFSLNKSINNNMEWNR